MKTMQWTMYQVFIDESYYQMVQGEENVYEYISSSTTRNINKRTAKVDKNELIDRLRGMKSFESVAPIEGLRIMRITKNKEEYMMGSYLETKNDAHNLKFKEHEVFKDKFVIVDESNSAFVWIDKETGKVSFSGKYYHLYREQRLLETLRRFVYLASEYLDGDLEDTDLKRRMKGNLEKFDELQRDFEVDKTPFYYKVGELVLFYWGNEWRQGKIINGYRTHDGIVNVELDNGEKVWCGENRHEEFIKRA